MKLEGGEREERVEGGKVVLVVEGSQEGDRLEDGVE